MTKNLLDVVLLTVGLALSAPGPAADESETRIDEQVCIVIGAAEEAGPSLINIACDTGCKP